jgi:hypothetical protein
MMPCAVLSAVVIAVTIHPDTHFARLLGVAPLRWIGRRSYGIYLWSYPVIVLTTPGNKSPGALRSTINITITFGLAALSWNYVEEPVRHGALEGLFRRARGWTLPHLSRAEWLAGSFAAMNIALCIVGLSGLVGIPSSSSSSSVTSILPTGGGSAASSGITSTTRQRALALAW